MDAPEGIFIVNIGQVERRLAVGSVAREALRRDGQFQVTAAVQAGLDFRNNGGLIPHSRRIVSGGLHSVTCRFPAGLQHDLLDIFCLMNPRSHLM